MQTERLDIAGMTCSGCVDKVTRALKGLSGVDEVKVSLETGEASIKYDERRSSRDQLNAAVKGAGYGVNAPIPSGSQPPKAGCCG